MNTDMQRDEIVGRNADGGVGAGGIPWRVAAWAGAALVLVANFVAMQFTDEVNWSGADFVFAAVLMFGALGAYELAVRMSGDMAYRAAVGLALAAAFLQVWINAAVGITDSDADGMYLVVVAIAIVGAFVARLRPAGMARAMFTAAFVTAWIGVSALIAGMVPAHNSAYKILALSAFFVTPWVGAALLFRQAAREGAEGQVA